ncbi:MAG TPA: class I SAM-dependent methyltransferase [Nannocystaceae bacterium]|nr:class I SAM-dependent methyltransferase [Nannocystaceae bacterium]
MTGHEDHWNAVYERKGADNVSWFQPHLGTSLALIQALRLPGVARLIDVGGGAATLVDDLLDAGFVRPTVLDISEAALATSQRRLGERARDVEWIVDDITTADLGAAKYDLWHDRAVFHFLTDPRARAAYVRAALRALAPGGHIIVATFGVHGPAQCSGLDVVRYEANGLHAEFGAAFEKIQSVTEAHHTPWGTEQEFLYCYCRRV